MSKKIAALLTSFLFLVSGNAFATDTDIDVDVDLSCPSYVKVGTALNVTVTATNYEASDVTLSRYMAFVLANANNTVGAASAYGPFAKTLAIAKIIPPGTATSFTVPVVAAAPNVPNKMALVSVQFITIRGRDIDGNDCWVNIVP